ncbi:citrate lyase subunit beta [Mycobacteroides abscessus]|nr:citrate lyase subunit beta [Mycobacteroides abscessus]
MTVATAGPGWLFCPADRPERFEKAAATADVVILDLEDGVAAADRSAAREALINTPLDPVAQLFGSTLPLLPIMRWTSRPSRRPGTPR